MTVGRIRRETQMVVQERDKKIKLITFYLEGVGG